MKAMIFAAGLGTRLKPLTDTMPKAMVPVCGKPLLQHVMEKLTAAGFDDITVNVHHFAPMIVQYLDDCYGENGSNSQRNHDCCVENRCNSHVHISDETDLLRETGGGIRHASKFLEGSEPFLVHNVDILSNLDLKTLVAEHRERGKDAQENCTEPPLATLVVSERQTSRYLLFDAAMRLVGWTNVKTGEIRTPFANLDVASCRKLAFSGIHMMSPWILQLMEDAGSFGMESIPEKFSIIDFYLSVAGRHPIYGFIPEGFRMLDVGKIDSLAEAEKFVTDSQQSAK